MSSPQYSTGGLGWTYWPSSDRYSLVPKWEEHHGETGDVFFHDEEANRYDLIGRLDAPDVFFTIDLVDWTDPQLPVVPDVESFETASKVWLPYGFTEEKVLTIEEVVDDDDLWTGKLKVTVPPDVQNWVGTGRVAKFYVDWWDTELPNEIVRIAHGSMVFRR